MPIMCTVYLSVKRSRRLMFSISRDASQGAETAPRVQRRLPGCRDASQGAETPPRVQRRLPGCRGGLSGCKGGLSGCRGGLSGCRGGLSGYKGGLSGCRGGLSGCRGGLSGCRGGLSGCRGETWAARLYHRSIINICVYVFLEYATSHVLEIWGDLIHNCAIDNYYLIPILFLD